MNINESSNILSTESILTQALPGPLAVPSGWHSEVLHSSSPIPNDIGTNLLNSNTNVFEKQEEYRTLSTSDAPPMIFSSQNETNRILNEIPSSTNSSISEYNNIPINDITNQGQKTILTTDEQTFIKNIDNQQPPPVVIRKTLPNNVVQYQQNISVRYLQPPTPPPPGPIIIRKYKFLF
jgi:hypothetical protein